jgi:hypothetical protein
LRDAGAGASERRRARIEDLLDTGVPVAASSEITLRAREEGPLPGRDSPAPQQACASTRPLRSSGQGATGACWCSLAGGGDIPGPRCCTGRHRSREGSPPHPGWCRGRYPVRPTDIRLPASRPSRRCGVTRAVEPDAEAGAATCCETGATVGGAAGAVCASAGHQANKTAGHDNPATTGDPGVHCVIATRPSALPLADILDSSKGLAIDRGAHHTCWTVQAASATCPGRKCPPGVWAPEALRNIQVRSGKFRRALRKIHGSLAVGRLSMRAYCREAQPRSAHLTHATGANGWKWAVCTQHRCCQACSRAVAGLATCRRAAHRRGLPIPTASRIPRPALPCCPGKWFFCCVSFDVRGHEEMLSSMPPVGRVRHGRGRAKGSHPCAFRA